MTPLVAPRRRTTAGSKLPLWGLIAGLSLLVGYPSLWLLLTAFELPEQFSVRAFTDFVGDDSLVRPTLNTVVLGVLTAIGTVLVGVPLAWYTAVTDGPFRRFVHLAVLATYITPPYLTAIAFTLLLSPEAGILNVLSRRMGGPSFDVYSMAGLVLVVTLHVCSFCYLLVHDALKRIDAPLIEAARTLQAGPWQVLRRILLPLVAPAVTGGALLAGILAMTEFGPQAVLGTPGGLTFLPTRIVSSLGGYPPRWADMAVLALILVVFAAVGLVAQRRALGKQSFITVTGRGVRPIRFSLGRARWPAAIAAVGFATVATVLPFGVLVSGAFARDWTTLVSPGNFTLENFRAAFVEDEVTGSAVLNSAGLAAAAATICVVIALAVAYFGHRTTQRFRDLPDYLAAVPLGLPATVLAFGLLLAVTNPPFQFLYGTLGLLLVLYVVRFLPLATRTMNSGASQLSGELELAARITGASWWQATRRISLPLIWPTVVAAWLLVLMPASNELGGTVVLYASGTETISIAIIRLNDLGQFGPVAALAVAVISALLLISGLAQWITTRRASPDRRTR
ncbi:ABC transporter permease [Ornithinimicrobium cavernae]|uniref:ABC transporter permease n=1 Tax=Ornithinimicrobium cavernae TaxID=2666047 RepID=UPI0013794A9A|nr:iron ABC transporter permease [Ornithinimicrobium cavernae]